MDHYQDMRQMSMRLNSAFDESGYSENVRQFRYKIDPVNEVLSSSNIKIVGSYAEGSYLSKSDMDCLVFDQTGVSVGYNPAEAYGGLDNLYLVLIKTHSTPAGYTKFKIHRNGKPCCKNDIKALDTYFNHMIKSSHGQTIFLSNRNTTDTHHRLNVKTHGPALTGTSNNNSVYDTVRAYESRALPIDMNSWFQRTKMKNWPSKTTCDLFETMGCCYVGVGHPNSPEQDLEWRISPTRQELHLMLNLKATQFRCYILLKLIKKNYIYELCGDIICSYHCKTALFRTIENNESDIWQPDKLMDCVLKCLKLLLIWVTSKRCPNYFIPNENMFETKLINEIQTEKLKKCLRDLISCHSTSFSVFVSYILIYKERDAIISSAIALKRKIISSDFLDNPSSTAKDALIIQQYIDFIKYKNHNSCIKELPYWMFPREIDKDILYELLEVKRLCLNRDVHLKSILGSKTFTEKDTMAHLKDTSKRSPRDNEYCLKLASTAAAYRQYSTCDVLLQNLYGMASVNIICGCHVTLRIDEAEIQKEEVRYNNVAYKIVKNHELTRECVNQLSINKILQRFTFCLQFDDSEIGMVLSPLNFEAHKTVGTPSKLMFKLTKNEREDLISIHPTIYMFFLQYKNSDKMNKKCDVCVALRKLENMNLVSLQEGIYTHPDTTLNLLGHIYKTMGWNRLALCCYRRSLQIQPYYNAVKWHVMFMLFGNPSKPAK